MPYFILCGDALVLLRDRRTESVDSIVTDPPAGISFMGKDWDDDKGGRDAWIAWLTDVMKECLRVLKPGGHALVWSIPRTSHWTATALENAGFEVRDCVTHLFGSGFPKSLDISKAIDKAAGAEREVIRPGFKSSDEQGDTYGKGLNASFLPRELTAPSTDAAKQWSGWGTALKPAAEFWWLVRKPLGEKTVAANVLKHGTGGLNIDGCRIEAADQDILDAAVKRMAGNAVRGHSTDNFVSGSKSIQPKSAQGRFPANLVLTCCGNDRHDEGCAVAELDRQSGITKSTGGKPKSLGAFGKNGTYGNAEGSLTANAGGLGDTGGASRFFYVAKASKTDKGAGNSHPTVKSTKLMEYLIRLITPPGGIVLDPFMGSGSTGVAALRAGFGFIGIEREQTYHEFARQRLKQQHESANG